MIDRARTALGLKIQYKLGKGGVKPELSTPAPQGQCDCSGYVAWCLGISRVMKDPFYKAANDGWFETTAIYKDILSSAGIFAEVSAPVPGCIAVYGDHGGNQGHIGIVTQVKNNKVQRVIHCSSSAWKNTGDAIAENNLAALTNNPNVRFGWFSRYSEVPLAAPATFDLFSINTPPALPGSAVHLEGEALIGTANLPLAPKNNLEIAFSIGEPPKYIAWRFPGEPAFFFQSRARINADGAPNAYHPNDIGIDWLLNAGRPTKKLPNGKPDKSQPHHLWKWWGISVDGNNAPYVQNSGHPYQGYYVSTTALVDASKAASDPARYVDSGSIPFIVLPGKQWGGARKGDLGWIVNRANGKSCGAIFADVGPAGELGELSIAAANLLGLKSNPKNGGTSKKEVLYIVFPGSGKGVPLTKTAIANSASQAFKAWGGDPRVASLPVLV